MSSEFRFDRLKQPWGELMIDLNKDEERGVQLFMAEHSVSREEAVRRILQDWLISHGYVSFDPDDEPLLNTGSERGAA